MAASNLSDMIKESLEGISSIAGSNTVIGEPINTNGGTVIIPVSKISMGFASGGVDYVPKGIKKDKDTMQKAPSSNLKPCFGGGGGTGISVTPIGFLVVYKDGKVEMLNIANPVDVPAAVGVVDSISSLAEKAPDIIEKLKGIFSKKDKDHLDDDVIKAETEKKDAGK